MILSIFTFAHVLISLIGIFAGLVVAYALINARQFDRWTSAFLWTTVLTSVTGFMFPFHGFKPSYVVGVISIIVLALAIFALYRHLNVFVLVVQLFRHVPALNALAPTQTEPAFKITQLVVLPAFVAITVLATTKLRHAQLRTA